MEQKAGSPIPWGVMGLRAHLQEEGAWSAPG